MNIGRVIITSAVIGLAAVAGHVAMCFLPRNMQSIINLSRA